MPQPMPWENDPEIPDEAHPEARIGADPSPGSDAWAAFREQIFGSPDRRDARAAGIGLTPTTAQMLDMGLIAGTVMAPVGGAARMAGGAAARAGGAAVAGGSRVANTARAVARLAAEHPRATQALLGAAGGGLHSGEMREALLGATIAALIPGGGRLPWRRAATEVAEVAAPRAAATVAETAAPRAAATVAETVAPRAAAPVYASAAERNAAIAETQRRFAEAAGLVPGRASTVAPRAASAAAPAAAAAAETAAPRAATAAAAAGAAPRAAAASAGREVAQQHANLMAFARDIAKRNPKVGEKIWILLDEAGKPVKYLTPDQAGAAARAGKETTWVRNLWS